MCPGNGGQSALVALRKESVDRNYAQLEQMLDDKVSLSARRAWIEMRNIWYSSQVGNSRSPQGERG